MNAQKAYVQAVASGEVTSDQVLAKICEYKEYIALNNIGSGYVMTGGNWFAGHGWQNEYDTKTPAKPEESKGPKPYSNDVWKNVETGDPFADME